MYGVLGHLMVHHQEDKIVSYLLSILLSGPRWSVCGGGGVGRIVILKFWIVKRENMNERGPLEKKFGEYLVQIRCADALDY